MKRCLGALGAMAWIGGCASALPPPEPIDSMAAASSESAQRLLAEADAAWARRGGSDGLAQAEKSQTLFLQAALAEPSASLAYFGAIRAAAFRLGRETDSGKKRALAEEAVSIGQRCEETSPRAAPCDYQLGAALGLLAREKSSAAHDALPHMVELLQRAEKTEPKIDHAGPSRVLALLYLRAPGWPLGPGDPDAGLAEAEAAVKLDPDYAPNQLALGEALKKSGKADDAKAAYLRALALATAGTSGGREAPDPDAAGWATDARDGLR